VLDKVRSSSPAGRVSYRALKINFTWMTRPWGGLKEELIEVHHCAVDQDGRMWCGLGSASDACCPPAIAAQAARTKIPIHGLPATVPPPMPTAPA